MPQTCTVCRHANLANIDSALLRRDSLRDVARQFGLSKDAVAPHKTHLSNTLVKAQAAQEVARADNLLTYVQNREAGLEQLDEDTRQIQETAMAETDRCGALDAIKARTGIARERRGYLELLGQLSGELGGPGQAPLAIQHLNILMLPVTQPPPEPARIVDAEPVGDRNS